jgi:flagellar export protein FliJ
MKRYAYRLEPLLKLKAHREKERQKEHALALQNVVIQKDRLVQIDGHRKDTLDYQRKSLSGALSLAKLQSCSRYLVKLKSDTLTGREMLRGLESEAEKRRVRLLEASREREKFEKHKEKLRDRHYRDADALEAKENDEIGLNTFRRHRIT